jgi:hypothetical protein
MIHQQFENKYFLGSGEALELIGRLFNHHLPQFLLKEKQDRDVCFYATYAHGDTGVQFGGERGYFEHDVKMGAKTISLKEYDERMKNVELASEKNIRFAFDVLLKLLSEQGRTG